MLDPLLPLLRYAPKCVTQTIVRQMTKPKEERLREIEVRLVESVEEATSACRLVYSGYVAKRWIWPHPSGIHCIPQMEHPSTYTFVALHKKEVIGTFSLYSDADKGLPIMSIFADEVTSLDAPPNKLGEAGALCVHESYRHCGVRFLLTKAVLRLAAERLGLAYLVVGVHPRSESFYRAALWFERRGGVRRYPGLTNNAAAVFMCLDLTSKQPMTQPHERFGEDETNPYYLNYICVHPQIRIVDAAFRSNDKLRAQIAVVLRSARPEIFGGLTSGDTKISLTQSVQDRS